jgi:Rieske 2Fe-2S family protein
VERREAMGTTRAAPIEREALLKVLQPFGHSHNLPAEAYVSDDVFAWERKHFFESSWMCVGRADELAGSGSLRAVRVGTESVLLVRDQQGILRGFYNVCRHRGHELAEVGECTTARVIRCPYHAWVYGLDGSLRGAPHFSERSGFDRSRYPLIDVRLATWGGWLFVNVSGDAPPLSEQVGSLGEIIADHEPARLRSAARHDYVIEANWKIITENYHECYHCSQIHPELCRVSSPDSGYNIAPDGAWVGGSMELLGDAATMSLTGASGGVVLRRLDSKRRREVFYFGLFPNLLLSFHPDYVMTHRIDPLGPSRSRIECEWLFPPEALERDGFDPAYAADFWDVTNQEDWRACEAVQRGAASRGFRQGPLGADESEVYEFDAMVARGYLGEPLCPEPRATVSFQSEQAS